MHATFDLTLLPPVATLVLAGELDILSRGQLAWHLIDLDALGCTSIRLDAGQVTHVDAGSLRLIDQARARVTRHGSTFEVVATSPPFDLVCATAGFSRLGAGPSLPRR